MSYYGQQLNTKHQTLNWINYLQNVYSDEDKYRSVGFLPCADDGCLSSLYIDGHKSVFICTFFDSGEFFDIELDDRYDDVKINTSHPYILVFVGCDDASYGKRFSSNEDREKFIDSLDEFNLDIQGDCYFING